MSESEQKVSREHAANRFEEAGRELEDLKPLSQERLKALSQQRPIILRDTLASMVAGLLASAAASVFARLPSGVHTWGYWAGVAGAVAILVACLTVGLLFFTVLLKRSSPEQAPDFNRIKRGIIEAYSRAMERSSLNPSPFRPTIEPSHRT